MGLKQTFSNLTPLGRLVVAILVVGVLIGLYFVPWGSIPGVNKIVGAVAPEGRSASTAVPSGERVPKNTPVVRVCVNTWGGFAGLVYMNHGFHPTTKSPLYQKYGIAADIVLIDDLPKSRDAWKANEFDLLWATVDSLPSEIDGLISLNPKQVVQIDWSRGGDVIVAARNIKSVNDLKGKTVVLAKQSPSHSLFLWALKAAGMTTRDVNLVTVTTAIDAASYFKSGQADAAVVWSPDDQDCLAAVPGSHVLESTKRMSHIIADVLYAREEFIQSNRDLMAKFVAGVLEGNAEMNANSAAFDETVGLMAKSFNQPEDFMRTAMKNVRFATLGDNINFFNIQGGYPGIKGEDLYTKTAALYQQAGEIRSLSASWRSVVDVGILRDVRLNGPQHTAEAAPQFSRPTDEVSRVAAFSSKKITVNFPTNSDVLDDNAKSVIDRELADLSKAFGNMRVRIEGNTDNTGSDAVNMPLSKRRAEAVANYLASTYNFSRNRFVVIGNGSTDPVAPNDSPDGRAANRRTEFELLPL